MVPAPLSVAYPATFAVLGVGLVSLLAGVGLAPMGLPLIGGFLLVAPALLAGGRTIIVPLLHMVTLPIMAFATECLYREVFPEE